MTDFHGLDVFKEKILTFCKLKAHDQSLGILCLVRVVYPQEGENMCYHVVKDRRECRKEPLSSEDSHEKNI